MAGVLLAADGGRGGRERARQAMADVATDSGLGRQLAAVEGDKVPALEVALQEHGWSWTAAAEPHFPASLSALADPPLGLFHRGPLPQQPAVAVVGARRATTYGREVAEYLGRELGAAGVWVVSGMARGVDAAAHRGALASGGRTAAVWGCGPDRVYPPEHASLAAEIAARGCLISEYPPGAPPLARHFPERNRLIAGLAQVLIVVEASERSGSLITARLALEEGREVMAVPGSVFSRLSAGPNGLLRAGAAPVVTAADVFGVLGIEAPTERGGEVPTLVRHLPAGGALGVDELAARAGQPIARILEQVLELELSGWLVREADGRYRRGRTRG